MKKEDKEFLILHLQEVIDDYKLSIDKRAKILNNSENNLYLDIQKRVAISHTIAILLSHAKIYENCIEEIKKL